jgi:hypothetical protein
MLTLAAVYALGGVGQERHSSTSMAIRHFPIGKKTEMLTGTDKRKQIGVLLRTSLREYHHRIPSLSPQMPLQPRREVEENRKFVQSYPYPIHVL